MIDTEILRLAKGVQRANSMLKNRTDGPKRLSNGAAILAFDKAANVARIALNELKFLAVDETELCKLISGILKSLPAENFPLQEVSE